MESMVDKEQMVQLLVDTARGTTVPEQGRKLSVTPQMRQTVRSQKTGREAGKEVMSEAEALLPDGPVGF